MISYTHKKKKRNCRENGEVEYRRVTFGRPPTPRAMSRLKEPVEMTSTCLWLSRPSHMTVSFPNFLVICWIAACSCFSFIDSGSSPSSSTTFLPFLPVQKKRPIALNPKPQHQVSTKPKVKTPHWHKTSQLKTQVLIQTSVVKWPTCDPQVCVLENIKYLSWIHR